MAEINQEALDKATIAAGFAAAKSDDYTDESVITLEEVELEFKLAKLRQDPDMLIAQESIKQAILAYLEHIEQQAA